MLILKSWFNFSGSFNVNVYDFVLVRSRLSERDSFARQNSEGSRLRFQFREIFVGVIN
jgi:hypothetical protein